MAFPARSSMKTEHCIVMGIQCIHKDRTKIAQRRESAHERIAHRITHQSSFCKNRNKFQNSIDRADPGSVAKDPPPRPKWLEWDLFCDRFLRIDDWCAIWCRRIVRFLFVQNTEPAKMLARLCRKKALRSGRRRSRTTCRDWA